MKRIGFLSFGHWQQGTQTPTARDALVQTIELAEAAEEIGIDGAYVRVHHFARQLASPFPLLAAIGARTPASNRAASIRPASRAGSRTPSIIAVKVLRVNPSTSSGLLSSTYTSRGETCTLAKPAAVSSG